MNDMSIMRTIVVTLLLLMPLMGMAKEKELKPRLVVCTDIAPADVEPMTWSRW